MDRISRLKKSTLDSSLKESNVYFGIRSADIRTWAEHKMTGSTALEVNNPWIPYSLLAGDSVESVNNERKNTLLVVYPPYFGLSLDYVVYCRCQPADSKTLEVDVPRIVRVIGRNSRKFISKSIWGNKKYSGPFAK